MKVLSFPSRPTFEISDMRVTIEEAVRVLQIAGYLQAYLRIMIHKLPDPDPFYAPGQPYYIFLLADVPTGLAFNVAVGAIDRIVVNDGRYFPVRIPSPLN